MMFYPPPSGALLLVQGNKLGDGFLIIFFCDQTQRGPTDGALDVLLYQLRVPIPIATRIPSL